MTQRELSIRTGMTEKHISTVIHGQKNISPTFARRLEYATGIEASFWMNLQANYDRELIEFEDFNSITDEEIGVLKNLEEVTGVWTDLGLLDISSSPAAMVMNYRMLFGISNLLDTPKITNTTSDYARPNDGDTDPYVLFAWQRMCELLSHTNELNHKADIDRLRQKIPDIKRVMFKRADQIPKELSDIFADCGIAFRVVPNFTGAPVQGFIKTSAAGSITLCISLRQKYADTFWFALFHEIAHILNGDNGRVFIDLDSAAGDQEMRADIMAEGFLIDTSAYNAFVEDRGYELSGRIRKFAASQNVKDYIVLGRLMKENLIADANRPEYKWAY